MVQQLPKEASLQAEDLEISCPRAEFLQLWLYQWMKILGYCSLEMSSFLVSIHIVLWKTVSKHPGLIAVQITALGLQSFCSFNWIAYLRLLTCSVALHGVVKQLLHCVWEVGSANQGRKWISYVFCLRTCVVDGKSYRSVKHCSFFLLPRYAWSNYCSDINEVWSFKYYKCTVLLLALFLDHVLNILVSKTTNIKFAVG